MDANKPPAGRPPRLVCIATHAVSANNLMRGQLRYLRERGYETILITAPSAELDMVARREQVQAIPVPMERNISPWKDLVALLAMCRVIGRLRPDIVNAGTPKAALLGMIASRLSGVPVRIYTLRGLRLETARGATRLVLTLVERVTSLCATRVLCVSNSLRETYVKRGLTTRQKTVVLGPGSSNGIEMRRFTAAPRVSRTALRERYGIPPTAPVLGFVGRLTSDKGIKELFDMFGRLLPSHPELRLVLLGDFEQGDPLPDDVVSKIRRHPHVIRPGFVANTAEFYPLFDLLVFPSHREGFPNVPLEAAAAGLPVVGFRATGTIDAVEEGTTGTLVPCGDVAALTAATRRYLEDASLRQKHGQAGRSRVAREFAQQHAWSELAQLYVDLLEQHRLPMPSAANMVLPLQFDARSAAPAGASDGWPSGQKFPRLQAGAAASHRLTKHLSFYQRYGKRFLDASIALVAIALLSPLLALTAVLVRWKLGTPVLFRQKRPGRHGVPFEVCKFRTMTDDRDESGQLLPDEHRLPPLGRWLRSTSLDELPELINVVRGEMSLIGPRPLMLQYLERYTPEQHRRHEVRPGLTGWSQVNGRNSLDWEEKFNRDVWYVDHMSFWLDLKILFLTPLTVLKREGISAGDHATMPEFLGTQATTASEQTGATSSLPKAA